MKQNIKTAKGIEDLKNTSRLINLDSNSNKGLHQNC